MVSPKCRRPPPRDAGNGLHNPELASKLLNSQNSKLADPTQFGCSSYSSVCPEIQQAAVISAQAKWLSRRLRLPQHWAVAIALLAFDVGAPR
jgi:hypothetical protein